MTEQKKAKWERSQPLYNQQSINWEALQASIDEMFPVKVKPTVSKPPAPKTDWETLERNARLLIPRRFQQRRFSEDVITWLGTPIAATIEDTTPVEAVRVSQSLAGGVLTFVGSFSMSEIGDPQTFCNERGLGLELRNAAGECVGKHVPTVDFVSFL